MFLTKVFYDWKCDASQCCFFLLSFSVSFRSIYDMFFVYN